MIILLYDEVSFIVAPRKYVCACYFLKPVSVTLFRKRVFAGVVKYRVLDDEIILGYLGRSQIQ